MSINTTDTKLIITGVENDIASITFDDGTEYLASDYDGTLESVGPDITVSGSDIFFNTNTLVDTFYSLNITSSYLQRSINPIDIISSYEHRLSQDLNLQSRYQQRTIESLNITSSYQQRDIDTLLIESSYLQFSESNLNIISGYQQRLVGTLLITSRYNGEFLIIRSTPTYQVFISEASQNIFITEPTNQINITG